MTKVVFIAVLCLSGFVACSSSDRSVTKNSTDGKEIISLSESIAIHGGSFVNDQSVTGNIAYEQTIGNPYRATRAHKGYEYVMSPGKVDCYYVQENGAKELVGTYNCATGSCGVYAVGGWHWTSDEKPVAILSEYEKRSETFLFDFKENKKISSHYESFQNLYADGRDTKYFIVSAGDQREGIIDTNGNVLISPAYQELGSYVLNGNTIDYSLKHNIITAKLNDKWGVIEITTGKTLIPFNYDKATIFKDENNVILRENKKWHIFNLTGEKIIETGFDDILLIDNLVIAVNSNKLDVLDLTGKKLNSESITTTMGHNKSACCAEPSGISVYKDVKIPDKIFIGLSKEFTSEYDYETHIYSFDIKTHDLTFVEKTR